MEIFKSEKVTLTVENGVLTASTNGNIFVPLLDAKFSTPDATYQAAIKKQGKNPDDFYTITQMGRVRGCFTHDTRPAVEKAINDYKTEIETARKDPARIERDRIHNLYVSAQRRIDYPGEYYPMLKGADNALAAWREKYPEAAKQEKKQHLLAEALKLEDLASGALVYDCDGSFSPEYQQQRHDEFMTKANAKRAEADAL